MEEKINGDHPRAVHHLPSLRSSPPQSLPLYPIYNKRISSSLLTSTIYLSSHQYSPP